MLRISAILLLLASASAHAEAPDFRTSVMPVLSKAGCNAGGCHGNANGKGGLKLSLRGQDPDLDWLAIVREQGGRRVNLLEPEQSLVLLKAIGEIPHEGGARFRPDSPEYAALAAWMRDGAPDSGAHRKLTALTVTPRERVLVEPEREVTLRAVARFSDGTERDVTRMTVFEPNNQLVKISVDGLVTRERDGETTILARYLDRQVPVHLAFIPARPGFVWNAPEPANFVDELVFKKLRTLRENPSATCDDTTFLRRAYLDLLGVIPSAETARTFNANPSPEKRAQLVEALLQRAEFADFWGMKWADLMKIEERQLDTKGMAVFHKWIRDGIAANKPLDQFARELIAARGSTYENPPANWWRANRDPVTRGESTARVFLGTQINCAQCHNHPFERWTQDDYYGWTALFARLDYKIVENKRRDKSDTREFKGDQIVQLKAAASVTNPRTGQPAPMRFLGAAAPDVSSRRDELQALADWLSTSPMFARAQVNRVWFHLFGRGLVEPVDDFRASNPASHPELLDALTREFVAHGYDLRWLIRTIMSSRTYQLAAEPAADAEALGGVASNAADEINFSRAIVRRLGAEQLLDSMSKALAAPLSVPGWPEATRLAQVPEGRKHYHPITTDLDRFQLVFGKPPRLVASECERSDEPTVGQAVQLLSGSVVQELLTRPGNRLDAWLGENRSDSELITEMFWNTLSRAPSDRETLKISAHFADTKDKRRALEDAMWALLNSKEFLFRR
jgi:hypothetical protein